MDKSTLRFGRDPVSTITQGLAIYDDATHSTSLTNSKAREAGIGDIPPQALLVALQFSLGVPEVLSAASRHVWDPVHETTIFVR